MLNSETVTDVTVPFTVPVDGGIYDGAIVCIQGTIPEKAKRFVVNLQNVKEASSDALNIAFHLSVRMETKTIIRNSIGDDGWGEEELDPPKEEEGKKVSSAFPFVENEEFKLEIKIKNECFEMYVNGLFYATFAHRMYKELGSILRIEHDVKISDVTFPGNRQLQPVLAPFYKPTLPFSQYIGPLAPGRVICVTGVKNENADHFNVNLKCGPGDTDVLFHFDVRYRRAGSVNDVVCNSRVDGEWGNQQIIDSFPFSDKHFHLVVKVMTESFLVSVDEKHYTEFATRFDLTLADTIAITGEADIQFVAA